MSANQIVKGVAQRLPRGKDVAALVAGLLLATGAASFAQQTTSTAASADTAACDQLLKAQSDALNYRIGMIQSTRVDTSNFFTDSGCLGGLALVNIDLSNFISDFKSAAKNAAMAAWEAGKKAAINKACTVAREQIAPMVDQYNQYAKMTDVEGAANSYITTTANQKASDVNAQYGTNLYYSGTGSTSTQSTTTVNQIINNASTSNTTGSSSTTTTNSATTGSGVF